MTTTRPRVLIVDDECIIADTLSLIFLKRGFDCCVAYGADEALECARDFSPQLLLCDLAMPGMGGLIMASIIAHELPSCRVLMLTGDARSFEEAWDAGNSVFPKHAILAKPVHPEDLLREARYLLSSAKPGFPAGLPVQ